MELAYYSDYAVRLVNSEEPARGNDTLTSVEAVRELFGANQSAARPRHRRRRHPASRSVRARLRAVFEAADEGDETLAVDLLNSLLLEFPVSPQISGHDYRDDDGRPDWHMHLADHPSNATAGYAAIAAWASPSTSPSYGVDRLGLCEAAPCRNAYLDTSTNRSRRYCSDRCATRANVAAYRARKRLEADRSAQHAADAADSRPAHDRATASADLARRPEAAAAPGPSTSSSGTVPIRAVAARERVVARAPTSRPRAAPTARLTISRSCWNGCRSTTTSPRA